MKINKNHLIYIVDDDAPLTSMICKFLEKQGYSRVKGFLSGEEMLRDIKENDPPIIIQDYDLPDINGLEIIKKIKTEHPKSEFIFLSGQSKIEIAVEAIKLGAFDYIIKDNFSKENVTTKIRNLLKIKGLSKERSFFKTGLIIFVILLLISWLALYLLFLGR